MNEVKTGQANEVKEVKEVLVQEYYQDGCKFGAARKSAANVGEIFRFAELENTSRRALVCTMQIHSRSQEAYQKLKQEAVLDKTLEVEESSTCLKIFASYKYSYSIATGNSFNHIFVNEGFLRTIKDNQFLVILSDGQKIRFSNRGSRF